MAQSIRYTELSPDLVADMVIDHLAHKTSIPAGLRQAAEQCGLGDLLPEITNDHSDKEEDA